MNKESLVIQLDILKNYLDAVKTKPFNTSEVNIVSHTIVGMIMTIHNLINTGAYDTENNVEAFSLIKEARDTALHYGYFNEYTNILPQAQKIIDGVNPNSENNFANKIINLEPGEREYYHLSSDISIEIREEEERLVIYNLHTKETLYLNQKHFITLENNFNNKETYLIEVCDEPIFFYKKSEDESTVRVSYNELKQTSFQKILKMGSKTIKLDFMLQLLISKLQENPYKNIIISYKYNNKQVNHTLHNVLKKLIYKNKIDERIIFGKYILINYDDSKVISIPELKRFDIEKLSQSTTLSDIFFIELFVNRYNKYDEALNQNINNYAKQSLLLNLFELSLTHLSDDFLNSDYTKQLSHLYHAYKITRKELAHNAITDEKKRDVLILNMERYSYIFYKLFSKILKEHLDKKQKNPISNFSISKSLENDGTLIHNKTNQYYLVDHLKTIKMIDGKKYLKLNNENLYLELDRSLFLLDYDNLSSHQCLVPYDQVKVVNINNNRVKKEKLTIEEKFVVKFDTPLSTLLQALDYLRLHPQYDPENLVAITFLDKEGKATYTEGIKNLIYRRYSQKIVPSALLGAENILVSKKPNEPLLILNHSKEVIAKVYLSKVEKEKGLVQILKNKEQNPIDYGKLLPKDLKTDEITSVKSEGNINEKRN